jgi:hypothetical protein
MKSFEFTILATRPDGVGALSEKLFEAGCMTRQLLFRKGLRFSNSTERRKASRKALLPALDNVTAGGANVLYVEPHHPVSLSDIAW